MFGVEFTELLAFGKQLGLAVSGAAALWGMVFVRKGVHEGRREKCIVFEWLGERLLWPLFGGVLVSAISWLLLFTLTPVFAHEGIVIIPSGEEVARALGLTAPIFGLWLVVSLAGFAWRVSAPRQFHGRLGGFYVLQFILVAVLASIPAWTGEFSRTQFFFIGHNVHSIFTLGTVLILDFLFLSSKSSPILKQHIFPFFPLISAVIWVGLAFDFVSVALVFHEAIALTPKFFFMQTVIGILIVNGVLLSGPITRKILRSIERGGEALTGRWTRVADVCGTISIVSWSSITFVDFFAHLTFSYGEFFGIYALLIVLAFLGHLIWEYFDRGEPQVA